MKKIVFLLFAFVAVTSCSKKEENKSIDVPTLETSTSALEAAAAGGQNDMPTTYSVPESQTVQAGVKLNPPHGEPGHICEIEVGAPLPANGVVASQGQIAPVAETAPNRPMPISPNSTSLLNVPINKVVPTGPKPKFNPAHGEPWHDCAIEVGAPLS